MIVKRVSRAAPSAGCGADPRTSDGSSTPSNGRRTALFRQPQRLRCWARRSREPSQLSPMEKLFLLCATRTEDRSREGVPARTRERRCHLHGQPDAVPRSSSAPAPPPDRGARHPLSGPQVAKAAPHALPARERVSTIARFGRHCPATQPPLVQPSRPAWATDAARPSPRRIYRSPRRDRSKGADSICL